MKSNPLLRPTAQVNVNGYTRVRQATILTALFCMQFQYAAPVLAAVAQNPLLSTTPSSIPPNFVLTLDNSESMALNHLPETTRSFVTSSGTVTVDMAGTRLVRMHPGDELSIETHRLLRSVYGYVPGSSMGTQCDTVFECQMRSRDVNTAYYNPEVRYQPWPTPNDPTQRMPNAKFNKAYYDPNDQTDDKWVDLSAVKEWEANWCNTADDCQVATKKFNPAVFYILNTPGVSDPTKPGSYTKYDLITRSDQMTWGGGTYKARTDCPATGACTLEQERQNFANWFTYHRARILFTKGAISEAFASLGNNFRLGWGSTEYAITSNPVDGGATIGGPTVGVREFSADRRTAFLKWLQERTLSGSTPLRFATTGVGRYFERTDNGSPWRENPGSTSATPILGCRRGGHILTTDGYYNDDGYVADDYASFDGRVGEVDNISDSAAQAAGIEYRAVSPYRDANNSNSLADIAMRFWAYPLIPKNLFANPTDTVRTKDDPATWLHLNQYMVGLGVNGTIDPKEIKKNMTTAESWPSIPAELNNTSPKKIDDMIHAAVNSRGLFFSVSDGESVKTAISSAINDKVASRQESGATTSGLTAVASDTVFVPEYNSNGWFGDIKAYTINAQGKLDLSWSASAHLPNPINRDIFSFDTGEKRGIAFVAANSEAFPGLGSNYQTASFINYIRGDESNAGTEPGQFRKRDNKLPDFVNSPPTLVKGNVDLNYDLVGLPSGGTSYRSFVTRKKSRDPLLFVGGNGGMLHAFNATTGNAQQSGKEVFAYIPQAALPKLQVLAAQSYNHEFFVDGPLTETDAFIVTNASPGTAEWINVLIGTMGAGGKSVFAIDVTGTARGNSTNPPASIGAANIMWEITNQSQNGASLGHVTGQVQVGYVQNNGGWYAFVGNGHDSSGGRAALLVVDLSTGDIVRSFELSSAEGVTSPNGLSGVSLIRNSQGEVIGAYAGDLHGQVWRFEFDGAAPGNWKVGFGGTPLFVARSRDNAVQKISAAPTHFKMPAKSGATGNLVVFGTGRLVESGDLDDRSEQTLYAVLDETVTGASAATSPLTGIGGGRAKLQRQAFSDKVSGNPLIQLTSETVDYAGSAKEYGWYLDLDITREVMPGDWTSSMQRPRVIYQPQLVRNLVFFSAITPPDTENRCASSSGGAFAFFLPVMTGGQLDKRTLDTNSDGLINDSDSLGQAYYDGDASGNPALRKTETDKVGTTLDPKQTDPNDGPQRFNECAAGGDGCGTQIISDRVWKRIVNPPF